MHRRTAMWLGFALGFAAAPALAQNPQPAPPGVVPAPVAPPSAASPPPEQIAPPGQDMTGHQTVVAPPKGTDPQMVKKPPAETQAK